MISLREGQDGDCCIIVASGPSALNFKVPDGIPVIAVNGAIDWVDRASYFFTLDLSPLNQARMSPARRRVGVRYCMASPDVCELTEIDGIWCFHRVSGQGHEPYPKRTPEWWLWRWSGKLGLEETEGQISNGNSAWGALNLAYHLGFKKVALVGVDATREPRIHTGGRPNELCHLPLLFKSALDQIDVVSCGKMSGIPQMSFEEWVKTRSTAGCLSGN